MAHGDYMRWTGDIFVVKVNKISNTLMDTTEDDVPDIVELLEQ